MPFLTVDEVRLYYEEVGSGEPLLFLHGLGSSGQDWAEQVEYFADSYRVLRLDLRGHGRSGRPEGPYHIAQFARDVAVFLRKRDAVPAHVAGLSMGGMIALELGASAPALSRSLVVVNSVADMRVDSWSDLWFYLSRRVSVQVLGMSRVGQLIARNLFVKPDQKELRQKFRRRWAQNDKDAYLWSVDAIRRWSVEDRLGRIRVPVFLVAADEDYTPVEAKRWLADRLPCATLTVVDDSRHALPVERPAVFNELVGEFLGSVDRREGGLSRAG